MSPDPHDRTPNDDTPHDPEDSTVNDDDLTPDLTATAAALSPALRAVATATVVADRRDEVLRAFDDHRALAPGGDDDLVPDRETITDDSAGEEALVIDLGDAPVRRGREPRRARWLLPIAAALVIALGVAAIALRDPREAPPTTSGRDVGPTAPAGGLGTGWFLPGTGWTIEGVETDLLDTPDGGATCPCTTWAAGAPDPVTATISVDDVVVPDTDEGANEPQDTIPAVDPVPDTEPTEVFAPVGDPVDVAGRTGYLFTAGSSAPAFTQLTVTSGGHRVTAVAHGMADDDVTAVVDAWLDAVEAGDEVDTETLPLPAGFVRTDPQTKTGASETLVAVTAAHASTGDRVEYQLVPAGFQRSYLLAEHVAADGEVLLTHGTSPGEGGPPAPFVAAIGGPADVTAGPGFFAAATTTLDEAELVAFLGGLHEVDAATWREALPASVAADDEVRVAETLFTEPLVG